MLGAFAQYFSDSLAKHTSKGIKERAMNGVHNGDVPFGYERCTTDCPAGGEGHWSLSARLKEQGFRTRNKHKMVGPGN